MIPPSPTRQKRIRLSSLHSSRVAQVPVAAMWVGMVFSCQHRRVGGLTTESVRIGTDRNALGRNRMIDRCILLLEEDDESRSLMVPALRSIYPGTTLAVCSKPEHARQWLRRNIVRCYFVCSGTDELAFLETMRPFGRVVLHTYQHRQNDAVCNRLGKAGWDVERCSHLHRGDDVKALLANWGVWLYSSCGEPDQLDNLWATSS